MFLLSLLCIGGAGFCERSVVSMYAVGRVSMCVCLVLLGSPDLATCMLVRLSIGICVGAMLLLLVLLCYL